LRDEGYQIEINSSYLVIRDIPYVTSNKEVKYGILVSDLTLAGDVTAPPGNHVVYFAGDYPCDKDGIALEKIRHQSVKKTLATDLVVDHSFSSKPSNGYCDYYEKMKTYISIISGPAISINPDVTLKSSKVIESDEDESVFVYTDTASSRSDIVTISKKLENGKIAIIGLGGTGSYLLDFLSKTPVQEIHLFDGDKFLQHNAFRSPGAPSIEELRATPSKVSYFQNLYSRMHKNINAHELYIDSSNIDLISDMNFVFICIDNGGLKKIIIEFLEKKGVSFIDVGMGINVIDDSLQGMLRITTSTNIKRDHVWNKKRISFIDDDMNNAYSRNIQIADLNALNATMAIIKWKKLCGFYSFIEDEYSCAYVIAGNTMINEDVKEDKDEVES